MELTFVSEQGLEYWKGTGEFNGRTFLCEGDTKADVFWTIVNWMVSQMNSERLTEI